MHNQTIVLSANRGYALSNSREGLIRHFIDLGWRVVLATADDEYSQYLVKIGAELEPVEFSRGGLAPIVDWKAWRRMRAIVAKHRPTLVHNFHAKPVILGSLAARRALGDGVRIVNSITGLGHAFVKGGWVSRLAGMGYRHSLAASDVTVFQNRDDRALFLDKGWVTDNAARLIVGSGVDVSRFIVRPQHEPTQAPLVVMMGRLIWQKGVAEFVEVARRIRQQWPSARFAWAGELDPVHPDAVSKEWIHEQTEIEYLGRVSDVPALLQTTDVLVFPSYYREGVPRTIMEAAASGVPTVAFDVPGVREAVRDEQTGFLVANRDVDALTEKVQILLEDADLRQRLGASSREMVEANFDIRAIEDQYLAVYRDMMARI